MCLVGSGPVLGLLCPLQHIRAPRWAFWWPGRVLQSCCRHRFGHRATCPHVPTLFTAPGPLSALSLCLDLTLSGQRSSCGCLCVFPLPAVSVFLWYCTPLQYSCLENPMDGGAWWAAVHGVAKSRTRVYGVTQSQTRLKQLSSGSSKVITHFPFFLSSL